MVLKTRTPTVGGWYKNEDGVSFEVLSIDEEDNSIEVQYFDGLIDLIPAERWAELKPRHRAAPAEDWPLASDGTVLAPVEEENARRGPWSGPLDCPDMDYEWGG